MQKRPSAKPSAPTAGPRPVRKGRSIPGAPENIPSPRPKIPGTCTDGPEEPAMRTPPTAEITDRWRQQMQGRLDRASRRFGQMQPLLAKMKGTDPALEADD